MRLRPLVDRQRYRPMWMLPERASRGGVKSRAGLLARPAPSARASPSSRVSARRWSCARRRSPAIPDSHSLGEHAQCRYRHSHPPETAREKDSFPCWRYSPTLILAADKSPDQSFYNKAAEGGMAEVQLEQARPAERTVAGRGAQSSAR